MTRPAALLAALLLLAGCTAAARETPEERTARLNADCTAAGFKSDTEAFRLCLLIQQTNDRLDSVERRLRFIDQDISTPGYPRRWWY
jgi:hypothetical protein